MLMKQALALAKDRAWMSRLGDGWILSRCSSTAHDVVNVGPPGDYFKIRDQMVRARIAEALTALGSEAEEAEYISSHLYHGGDWRKFVSVMARLTASKGGNVPGVTEDHRTEMLKSIRHE